MTIHYRVRLFIAGLLLSAFSSTLQAAPDESVIQDMAQRIDELGREINQLRGENERLNYELRQLRESQKKGFLAIDKRLGKVQQASPAVAVKPAPVAATAKPANVPAQRENSKKVAQPVSARPVENKPSSTRVAARPAANSEKAAYNHAYETLKGNRQAGVEAFTQFLKQYPKSSLAENAHYWIGEAHYAQKNYQGAIDSFVVVLNKYKSGRKAPDAAVKLGYSFYALKDWTLARRTFKDVLRYFPGSNAAKLAQARLDRMQKEGH